MRSFLCLTLLSALSVGPDLAAAATGADVIERARTIAARVHDKSMRITMTIDDPHGAPLVRTLEGFEKATAEGRKLLWVFDSPTELAGTSLLAWQEHDGRDHLWVYFPAQRRVRQVTDQMRRERFQGSDLTYEDLTAILYFDYGGEDRWLRDELCAGAVCDVVETTLPTDLFAYRRLITWVRRDLGLPYRIEFYDEQRSKVVEIKEVATIDGIPEVVSLAAEGHDGSRTTVRFDEVHFNTGLEDQRFSVESLSRGK